MKSNTKHLCALCNSANNAPSLNQMDFLSLSYRQNISIINAYAISIKALNYKQGFYAVIQSTYILNMYS